MTTTPATDDMKPAPPWTADKIAAVVTAAVYEHFYDHLGTLTLSSSDHDEAYELHADEDGDVITFQRKSDGARFEVEFWANVAPVKAEVATDA